MANGGNSAQQLEQLPEWHLRDFSEGLIDSVDDNLLPENAARDCQNFISRTIGTLQKRLGQARLNPAASLGGPIQGLYAYYYGTPISTRRLVAAADGVVAWWDPGTSAWVELKTAQSTTQPFMFETCVNYMVCFNGVDQPWKWNGSEVSNLLNAPADGRFPILYKEKLFVVPISEPSTLRWSASFQPEDWPEVNYWDVKKGDGDEITCLRHHLGELVIFKRRSLHVLRGTSLDDFKLEEMESRLGCVGIFAAAALGPYLYFVSDEGLCVWNGMRVVNISDARIPQLWDSINKAHVHKASVGVWDGLVWFALPEGSSTYNNLVIVYDPPEEGGTGGKFWPWRGINASCFQEYNDGTQVLFYAGDSSAGYVNQQAIGTEDFGSPIEAYWIGKGFDHGSAEREKKAKRAFLSHSPDTEGTVTLAVSLNYGNFATLTFKAGDSLMSEYLFIPTARWRYLTPKLSHSTAGGCKVRGLMVPYKIRRKPKVREVV